MTGVALVYVRVSRFDVSDRGHKVSPEVQEAACRALPALRAVDVEVFRDLDYSGKDMRRPGFEAMRARLADGRATVVACYSLSRLSRSVAQSYAFLEDLQRAGIGFVSATEPFETVTAMGKAFMGQRAVWNQLERELTAERVRDALAYKRSHRQLLGTLPVGYSRDGSGTVVTVPAVARVIRMVFEKYATGAFSFRSLATSLNQGGVKTVTTRGGNAKPPARLWSGDVIKEILERPTYAGLLPASRESLRRGERVTVVGNHPQIVPLDLWKRCEEIRHANRPPQAAGVRPPRHRSSRFPLSPLLRCVACSGPMCGATNGDAGANARYYVCSDRRRYGPDGCHAPRIRAEVLEAELSGWLAKCQLGDQVEDAARQLLERGLRQRKTASQDLNEHRTVAELEARLARAVKAWQVYGVMTEEQFRQEKAEVDARIARARALPSPPTIRQVSARITDLVRAWDGANAEQRARLVAAVLTEVHVEKGAIVAIMPRAALRPYFQELIEVHGRRERETGLEPATMYLEGTRSTS